MSGKFNRDCRTTEIPDPTETRGRTERGRGSLSRRTWGNVLSQANFVEARPNRLCFEEHKKNGVCWIPPKQDAAAREILSRMGRTLDYIEGGRGRVLYFFTPPLEEDERTRWFGS